MTIFLLYILKYLCFILNSFNMEITPKKVNCIIFKNNLFVFLIVSKNIYIYIVKIVPK
jgi:hypothetical protein